MRAIRLIQEVGLYGAQEQFRDPAKGFLDSDKSGLHVIGFTREGIVFLDNSGQTKPGMDISGILGLQGDRLLPAFLDAADGENGGHTTLEDVWPNPVTHETGPMSAWCGALNEGDVVCALAWRAMEGSGE
jgi:hypothetical protein